MPGWKSLTSDSGATVDVNMDQVCYMQGMDEGVTVLYFAAANGKEFLARKVKEKPDEIHMAKPLRSM
jgi:hypothetical protein